MGSWINIKLHCRHVHYYRLCRYTPTPRLGTRKFPQCQWKRRKRRRNASAGHVVYSNLTVTVTLNFKFRSSAHAQGRG